MFHPLDNLESQLNLNYLSGTDQLYVSVLINFATG